MHLNGKIFKEIAGKYDFSAASAIQVFKPIEHQVRKEKCRCRNTGKRSLSISKILSIPKQQHCNANFPSL